MVRPTTLLESNRVARVLRLRLHNAHGGSRVIHRRTTLIVLLVASVGVLLAGNLLDFPLSVPWLLDRTGGAPILDTLPFRNGEETNQAVAALGPEGRRTYLSFIWTADLALPLLLGACLYVVLAQASAAAAPQSRLAAQAPWLGVAAATADYAENLTSTALLIAYPERLPLLADLSGPLTLVKFVVYGWATAVALLLFAASLVRRIGGR